MKTINCRGKLLDLSVPRIAGILNVTPDSFFDGGMYTTETEIIHRTEDIVNEGADIIDIGAYSSRPGAEHISEKEELKRLIPALKHIRKHFPDMIISVDTFRASVARIVVSEYEVDIVNDISGGSADGNMFDTIAELNVPFIMMHMRGTPKNMQEQTDYNDIFKEIILYFVEKIAFARKKGINDIIIDPGFGFSKTTDQNYKLLNGLDKFKITDCPILVGLSRKSMLYKVLDTSPENVLPGTTVLHTTALQKGADILRVHDVKEAVQVVKTFMKLRECGI